MSAKLPMYVDADLCSACGGACCKSMPGLTRPEDWGSDRSQIVAALAKAFASGKYAIDWWEGDVRTALGEELADPVLCQTEYVRPATVTGRRLRDPSWGGQCVQWTTTGCSMAHDDRPYECRMLKPTQQHKSNGCDSDVTKAQIVRMWLPYQDVIDEAAAAVSAP
jgi:hypothetical protein